MIKGQLWGREGVVRNTKYAFKVIADEPREPQMNLRFTELSKQNKDVITKNEPHEPISVLARTEENENFSSRVIVVNTGSLGSLGSSDVLIGGEEEREEKKEKTAWGPSRLHMPTTVRRAISSNKWQKSYGHQPSHQDPNCGDTTSFPDSSSPQEYLNDSIDLDTTTENLRRYLNSSSPQEYLNNSIDL